jgi:hypothetical protein
MVVLVLIYVVFLQVPVLAGGRLLLPLQLNIRLLLLGRLVVVLLLLVVFPQLAVPVSGRVAVCLT